MTTPTPTEERLRSMLIELADSTPVRTDPLVPPIAAIASIVAVAPVTEPIEPIELIDSRADRILGDAADEVGAARRRRFGGSRLPWALTAVAGVLVAVLLVSVLRAGDAADPFAAGRVDVPTVDLSALDGGQLAFVVGNDLFVADARDGVTRRITDVGRGNEVSNLSWSHDGEWLAFDVHDQDGFWIVRRDGSERHHLPGSAHAYVWSPTNDELVYVLGDEVRLAQVDGSWRALEGNFPPAPYTNVVWSPDGNRVAFAGAPGNLAIGTLEGRPGAGWDSGSQPPVRSVVAWPLDDHLVVEGLDSGDQAPVLSFDPATGRTTPLATLDARYTADWKVGVDPAGSRVVIVTDADIRLCLLDQGPDAPCRGLGVPGSGLVSPVFVPGSDEVSFLSTDQPTGASLVTLSTAVGAPGREPVVVGRVATVHLDAIQIGAISMGVGPEPQVPLRGGFLVRVDERSIDFMTAPGSPGSRTVVAGNRFGPPADDYPGGTGLAYWHP